MLNRNPTATLLAFLLSFFPLSLFSQGPAATPEVQGWLVELKDIQERLSPVERAALGDPAVQLEQEAIGEAVLAAMIASDPTVEAKLDRLREIMLEAHGVDGDGPRMDALIAEVQSIRPQVEQARGEALARPEIEARVAAFRRTVHTRMIELDPDCRELITRFQELERMIRQSLPNRSAPVPVRG